MYEPSNSNKKLKSKDKDLVKAFFRWYNEKYFFLSFWQIINLPIKEVN